MVTNPIQILPRPNFNEASGLRPVRDSSNPERQWIKHRENTSQIDALVRSVRLLKNELDMLKRRVGSSDMDTIRVQLCVDGVPTYYLLYGEVDPDQTP